MGGRGEGGGGGGGGDRVPALVCRAARAGTTKQAYQVFVAIYRALPELHIVLCECSCLVREDVLNLGKTAVDSIHEWQRCPRTFARKVSFWRSTRHSRSFQPRHTWSPKRLEPNTSPLTYREDRWIPRAAVCAVWTRYGYVCTRYPLWPWRYCCRFWWWCGGGGGDVGGGSDAVVAAVFSLVLMWVSVLKCRDAGGDGGAAVLSLVLVWVSVRKCRDHAGAVVTAAHQ